MLTQLKRFTFAYIVLTLIFLASLIFTCLIPSSLLTKNISKSLSVFKKEGNYPTAGSAWRPIALDNYTDSLMFNTAYSVDSTKPFPSAMLNIRYLESAGQVSQIVNLEKLYQKKALVKTGYERYWHGYLIFLRPLLVFFPYSTIRNIVTSLLYLVFLIYIVLVAQKLGKKSALFVTFGLIMVDFFSLGKSLQFSGVFLVGLISSIYLLLSYKNNQNLFLLFFLTGGLTAFFDLLTTPLIPLGLLLIIAVHLEKKQKIIFNCIFWALGYLLFWSSKWLIVEVFVTPGALATSFNQIVNRTVNQADANFSQFKAVQLNLLQLIGYSRYSRAFFIFINSIFFLGLLRYLTFDYKKVEKIIPWVLMIFIPYLWYLVAANHSYLHCWYTYRDQLMSVVSLLFITTEFVDWDYLKKDLKGLSARLAFKNRQN